MADRSIKVRLEAEIGGYKRSMDEGAKSTERFAQATDLAARKVDAAASAQKVASAKTIAAQKQLEAVRKRGNASAEELARAEHRVAAAKVAETQASVGLRSAQTALTAAQLAGAEAQLVQMSALKKMGAYWQANRQDIDQVANSLVVMGGAGTLALAGATKAAMNWETAWAGVTKTVDGTDAQMAALEKGLRGMSKVLPASQGEIAGVAEAAGQLGVGIDSIEGFTKTMIDLGETTNLTSDEAATSMAQLMNVMGTSGDDVDRLGAALVELGNNGASTEKDILDMAQRLSGAGKLVGASESDVLALGNAMASLGIESQLGGGVMTRVLTRIYGEVQIGGAKLDAFAETAGMSAQEFAAAFQSDPIAAVDAMVQGLERIKASGGNVVAAMADMGVKGTEETSVLLRLAGAGDLLSESLEMGANAWEKNSALTAEAIKRYETAESQAKMALNGLRDAAIDMGSYVLPIFTDMVNGVSGAADAFSSLPGPVKQSIVALGGITSVTALAAGGALKLAGSIADSYLSFQRLKVESPRLAGNLKRVGVAAGIAGAAFTALSLAASWDGGEATQGLEEIEAGLKAITEGANATEKVFTGIGDSDWWEASANGAKDLAELLEKISSENLIEKAQGKGVSLLRGATDLVGWDTRTDYERQTKNLEEYLNAIAGAASTDLPAASEAFKALNDAAGGTAESAQKLMDQSPALRDALIGVASDAGLATDDATLLKVALGEVAVGAEEAESGTRGHAQAALDSVAAMQMEADAAEEAAQAIMDKARATAEGISSEIRFEESLDRARDAIKENGKSLDLSTEKGRENMSALLDYGSASLDVVEDMRSLGASQEEIDAKMGSARKAFLGLAKQAGATGEEARALAEKLGLVPGTYKASVQVSGIGGSVSQVQALNSTLNSINGKTVTATVAVKQYGQAAMAEGGIRVRANGALDDPQIRAGAGRGVTQVSKFGPVQWAEGETEWEAFIPGARSKRPRALAIWEETGRRLGAFEALGMESFAAGGLRSSVSLKDAEKDFRADARTVSRLTRAVKDARRSVKSAERGVKKAGKTDRKGDDKAAKKRLDQAKKRLDRLEDRLRDARDAREDAKRRLADLRESRKDLSVEGRRGEIQDQTASGLSGAYSAVDRILAAADDPNLTKRQRQSLGKSARSAEKELVRLYAAAEKAETALERSKGHLDDMRQISAGIKGNLSGGFKLTDAFTSSQWTDLRGNVAAGERKITAKGMLTGGKSYASKLKKFGASIKKLADYGLSSTILQEIAGLGPDEGQEVAAQLLAGGKKSVQELNGVYRQIENLSGYIGNQSTRNFTTDDGKFYAGGVSQAAADVKAQQKRLDSINGSIEKWGTKIAQILGKAYGVKMASGGWVTGGVKGVDSVPITGMPGEYMVNAKAAQQYGPLLESINTGRGVPVMSMAVPTQTNVNVALDKASVAAAWDGMKVVLEVDGKPMKAVMRTEMNAAFSAAGRGY